MGRGTGVDPLPLGKGVLPVGNATSWPHPPQLLPPPPCHLKAARNGPSGLRQGNQWAYIGFCTGDSLAGTALADKAAAYALACGIPITSNNLPSTP